jgi:hypothetical protein
MTRLQCVTRCMVMILTALTVRYWSEQFASDSRTVLPSSLLTTHHPAIWDEVHFGSRAIVSIQSILPISNTPTAGLD